MTPNPGATMRWTLAGLMTLALTVPAAAQWRVAVGVEREQFGSLASGFTEFGSARFVPDRPVVWSLRVEGPGPGGGDAVRLGFEVRRTSTDLALVTTAATLVPHDGLLAVTGLAPLVRLRVGRGARAAGEVELAIEGMPLFEWWAITGEPTALHVGGLAGVGLRVPFTRAVGLDLGLRAGITPGSVLGDPVPEDLETKAARRWSVRAAVLLGL